MATRPSIDLKWQPSSSIAQAENRRTPLGLSYSGAMAPGSIIESAVLYEVRKVDTGTARISSLIAGDESKPTVLLVHGLGATKASLLPIVPRLTATHRVIAIDLPGFGDSSKPRGTYDAPWFADHILRLLETMGIERTALVGNSMGGRIVQEIAIEHPDRVESLTCLCPATAFSYRPGLPLVKLLRPELGIALGRLPRSRVIGTMKSLFARSSRVDDAWFQAAADDFLTTWRSPRARMAFFAAVRNLYLEEPYGEAGFWERLRRVSAPALYIFGQQDTIITPRFGAKVASCLPDARVEVWDDCGHVPQVEHPERTGELLASFLSRSDGEIRRAG